MKYNVKVCKVNSGIKVQIENMGKLKDKDKIDRIFDAAHDWWKNQVMVMNNLEEDWFKWKDNRSESYTNHEAGEKIFAYEPWGFAVNGQMNDSGSCPTGSRVKTLEAYQSPFDVIKNGIYLNFNKHLVIETSKHERFSYITVAKVIEVKEMTRA